MRSHPLTDIALSRRLERAEATAGARFVEARAKLSPESGACWIELSGAYAMYDGAESPSTQTFGFGLFTLPSARDLSQLEEFYRSRQAPVFHEVSPLADASLLNLMCERGYSPVELTSVMCRTLEEIELDRDGAVTARLIGRDEIGTWARVASEGWVELTEFAGILEELMRVTASRDDGLSFIAESDGEPVAAGALFLHEGVALLAGSSTIPRFRNRGAQRALLQSRLAYAREHGADLAMICAAPGSASQRNAERQGFRIAYTRIKWKLMR